MMSSCILAILFFLIALPCNAQPSHLPIKPGFVLVATPNLLDPNFQESVVLICRHETQGTIGLILNKPLELSLSDAFPTIKEFQENSVKLYRGGPVHPRGILLLLETTQPYSNMQEAMPGVYFGGTIEAIKQIVTDPTPHNRFRLFAGFASWFPGQLHMEIEQQAWSILPVEKELLFDAAPQSLWSQLRNRLANPQQLIKHQP